MATWKRRERKAARLLGAERNVGSGSCGRKVGGGVTASDSTHATLFVETKSRIVHATRTLWEATARLAKAEAKTPVLALADRGKPGLLWVVHERDGLTFARALLDAEARREAAEPKGSDPAL